MIRCAQCGTSFMPSLRHPEQRYCSKTCWNKARWQRIKAALVENETGEP